MMRQTRKQTLTIRLCLAAFFATAVFVVPAAADSPATAYVVDTLTGVALDGMDPVSYFTGPVPLPGKSDFEYDWAGVPWYFANGADRDIFIRSPEVYAPQFGGHATISLAQNFLSDGDPRIYLIVADRLYLFYSEANRTLFNAAPITSIDNARKHWAALTPSLSASTSAP